MNTPETDSKSADHIGFWSCATVPTDFARKLERERDEARRLIKDTAQGIVTSREEMLQIVLDVTAERDEAQRGMREQHAQIIGLYAIEAELRNERDRLRKVCDSLAQDLSFERGEGEVARFFVCKFGGLKLRAGLGVSHVKK